MLKRFSLILCTFGDRVDDLVSFFDSLNSQCFDLNYIELIIVDQNPHDKTLDLLKNYPELFVISKYLKSEKGLSLSRNVGLGHSSGEIVAFPDDDCIYDSNILTRVSGFFENNKNIGFISTRSRDLFSNESLVSFPSYSSGINSRYLTGCSFTLFFRRRFVDDVETFDINMGVGTKTKFGAGEEHDFMLRGLSKGHIGSYLSDLCIYHPVKGEEFNKASFKRRLSYSSGLAYFLVKNRGILGGRLFLLYSLNQFALLFSSLKIKKVTLNFISLIGFIKGLISAWNFLR